MEVVRKGMRLCSRTSSSLPINGKSLKTWSWNDHDIEHPPSMDWTGHQEEINLCTATESLAFNLQLLALPTSISEMFNVLPSYKNRWKLAIDLELSFKVGRAETH